MKNISVCSTDTKILLQKFYDLLMVLNIELMYVPQNKTLELASQHVFQVSNVPLGEVDKTDSVVCGNKH